VCQGTALKNSIPLRQAIRRWPSISASKHVLPSARQHIQMNATKGHHKGGTLVRKAPRETKQHQRANCNPFQFEFSANIMKTSRHKCRMANVPIAPRVLTDCSCIDVRFCHTSTIDCRAGTCWPSCLFVCMFACVCFLFVTLFCFLLHACYRLV
jgi:hypothetical protein